MFHGFSVFVESCTGKVEAQNQLKNLLKANLSSGNAKKWPYD